MVITKFDWNKHGDGDVYVPRTIDGYNVTEIGALAFSNSEAGGEKHVTVGKNVSVVLPDTITVIGEKAFFCTNIASCDIPVNVQFIGAGAFSGCPNIRQFSVNSQNRYFAVIDGVLYNKVKKELVAMPLAYTDDSLSIPNGIKSIGDYAFYHFDPVTKANFMICFPESVTKIGSYAFYGLGYLYIYSDTSICVTEIGDYAFAHGFLIPRQSYNGEKLGDEQFAPESIGAYAFAHSYGFAEDAFLSLHNLKYMGEGAFSHAKFDFYVEDFFPTLVKSQITHLPAYAFEGVDFHVYDYVTVSLPSTVVEIGKRAFADAKDLDIVIPASVTTIREEAFANADLCSFTFDAESKLRRIENKAFMNAIINVTTLELPEPLEHLGYRAFYFEDKKAKDCPLNRLVVPENVSTIGDEVVNRKYVVLEVAAGSYADLWASENGYPMETDDTSWLFE